jgi:membrane protease subunit (stomatin/prohibitin family)
MNSPNVFFLEVIEWFDETGKELVHRIPETGSGDIKFGAQLTVRESQAAVFFYQGRAVAAFGPGRHTLKTLNIPILTKILSSPWGMTSPLRAEVYFVNLKTFTNLKWGTRDPVAFKDAILGLVRLRAFGVFNLQVVKPGLFINTLVGTQGMFTAGEIEDYLNQVVVSRLNDYLGETLDSLLNLPARYDEMSVALSERLKNDFERFGMSLDQLFINAITPPAEVQQAIDDRSRMGAIQDMNRLMQMKTAMAIEKAAENEGGAGAGLGTGMGLMMPGVMAPYIAAGMTHPEAAPSSGGICPKCRSVVSADAKFCPQCGSPLQCLMSCHQCGKPLMASDKFCPACGCSASESAPQP